jgi:hypothetical protein
VAAPPHETLQLMAAACWRCQMRGKWLLLPPLVVSVACLAASGYFAVGNLLFLSAASTAEGRVAANREQWQKGRNAWWRSYLVSVEFTDGRGVHRTIES